MKTTAQLFEQLTNAHLTERGRSVANRTAAVIGAAGLIGGAAAAVEATHRTAENSTRPTASRLASNETLIKEARSYTGKMTLKGGVKLRLSPAFIDGDNSTGEPSNVAVTIPEGKTITVHSAIVDKGGWVAFDRPDNDSEASKTTKEMAEQMVYVNVSSLEQLSPTSIQIQNEANNTYLDHTGHVQSFTPGVSEPVAQMLSSQYAEPVIE